MPVKTNNQKKKEMIHNFINTLKFIRIRNGFLIG